MKIGAKLPMLIICITIISLIILCGLYQIIKHLPYERDYFGKIGVDDCRYFYKDMIRDFGEPLEIVINDSDGILKGWTEAVYGDFIMSFEYKTENAFLQNIKITSKNYRFGWRNIGVGSTKRQVEVAYKNVFKSPDQGYAYIDNGIWVEFFYDEKDIVNKIMIFNYYLN